MKLIYRIALRLSAVMLPLMVLWAVVFYFTMIEQINDDADDVLEDYSELIIMRLLSGHPLPEQNDPGNNSYTLTRVSERYALSRPGFAYYDAEVYIPEKRESEPARILTTIFCDAGEQYYELSVSIPTFEKDDLMAAVLQWVVALYALLLLTVLGMTTWVFHRNMRPLYRLLQWLSDYRPGSRNAPVPNDTAIREFRQLNTAVQRVMDRSEELFEQQKHFIGNASHELQTPLSVLNGRVEWLLDHAALDREATGQLISMQRTLAHIVRLNKTLLLLSKIDNKQFPQRAEVDIAELCREQVELCDEIYAERGIRTTLRLPERFVVCMNESLAGVLVSNLVRNAYIHTPAGGCVELYIDATTLAVLNDGDKPLDGTRIFERFYQGAGREGSAGLGLALVKAVGHYYALRVEYDFAERRHHFRIGWTANYETASHVAGKRRRIV